MWYIMNGRINVCRLRRQIFKENYYERGKKMTNRTAENIVNPSSLCNNEQGQIVGVGFNSGHDAAAFPDKSRIRTVRAPLE